MGVLLIGLVLVLLSGCGQPRPVQSEGALPGTPAVPLGPDQPVAAATPTSLIIVEPPPPPTPGPAPAPRPIALPSATQAQQLTADWKVFESDEFGIRFKYPDGYQVRVQKQGAFTALSVDRPLKDSRLEELYSLFIWPYQGIPLATAEDLLKWEASLPPETDLAGGRVLVTGEVEIPQIGKGWAIRWEPLPGNSEVFVDSVVLPVGKWVIWFNLSEPLAEVEQKEQLFWSQQMAALATLEVTR